MEVSQAIESRRSARRFLDRPVDREVLEEVCRLACLAPSAINLQPWLLTVVVGRELERLSGKLLKAFQERRLGCAPAARAPLSELYLERQKLLFAQMNPAIRATPTPWNDFINDGSLHFYGASAAIVAAGDSTFASSAQLDLGLAVGYLLLACQDKGLATCPVGLVSRYSEVIQEAINLPENRTVFLALAVGYRDESAPVNQVKTGRAPLEEVVRFYG